ncbi:MAG: sodium:alanine symporter family protein [Treponema sp.]|nr:sodium:alanine symporter family protein [Treponema sp.]
MGFLDQIMEWNDALNSLVWGPPMLFLIVGSGIFLTLILKFIQVSRFKIWWKETFGQIIKKQDKVDDHNISPFQALTTAMASTVGTGNIAGVATAIFLGGPGAIFWMWVSGFFGMATKYAEIVLALKFRIQDEKGAYHGGPMYYIEKGLKMKWLAVIFAFFGAIAAFGIGNLVQANAVAGALNRSFGIPNIATGIVLAALVGIVIIGGIKRIANVTEKLVPFMAVFYIIGGLIILIMNITRIPAVFGLIFSNAFSFQSVGGGIMGYAIMRAMRFGIARGVFSNEAGLGSAPIAHAASRNQSPVTQGFYGIFEVFVDTLIICNITALVILVSGLYTGNVSGIILVQDSFSNSFGAFGGVFVAIAILSFAGSTILGWSYYGMQCLGYLTKKNPGVELGYKILFSLLVIVGAIGGLTWVWDVADTLNGLMAIPNLIALVLLSKVVIEATKQYFADKK